VINLRDEGYRDDQVHLVGTIMVDTLLANLDRALSCDVMSRLGSPSAGPARSVAAYAAWLEGMEGLDGVLAEADARMRALGVVKKAAT
jgi:hypothetical protein